MKTVCKKLFSLMLVAILLVSALPFQAFAASTTTLHFYEYDFAKSDYVLVSTQVINKDHANYWNLDPKVENPAGWKFDGWVQYSNGMTFEQVNKAARTSSGTPYVGTVYFAAAYVVDTASVEFIVNVNGVGADITKPANANYVNRKVFGYSATFPYPASTPTGHTFGGWKYGETILTSANWSSVAFDSSVSTKLYAHWIPDSVTVTFYRWNETNKAYEAMKAVEVPYGTAVKAADVPSTDDVDTKDKYAPNGWKDAKGNTVVPSNTTVTVDTAFYAKYLGDEIELKLNPKSDDLKEQTKIVRIGEKIGDFGGKLPSPSLTGYVFQGWFDENGNQVTDETVFWNSYSVLYAKWAPQGNVRLIVYKEGDLNKPIVDTHIPDGVAGGNLDVDKVQLASYLPAGATYKLTGYFNKAGWDNYLDNRIINTVDYIQVDAKEETRVYALVSVVSNNNNNNNNTGSGSNNTGNGNNNTGSNKPADPSNPATGDDSMIFASMTVMTLAAAALVVVMQLRKRKMI